MSNLIQRQRNWKSFVLQSGRWNGDWLRYDCRSGETIRKFRGIRDLPLRQLEFMDHTNYYQGTPDGDWVTRAFRGYRFADNCLDDGIMHRDFSAFRGVFSKHGSGVFSNVELGPSSGMEIYMVKGRLRFSVVLKFGSDGKPDKISLIREERSDHNNFQYGHIQFAPHTYWTEADQMTIGQAHQTEMPAFTAGELEVIEYPGLDHCEWLADRNDFSDILPASGLTRFALPDGITLYCPADLTVDGTAEVVVVWEIQSGRLKIVHADFNDYRLARISSFQSIQP